ncbi:hypothetical protein EVAR_90967_1 [Eumeta japonica]|uniref:Uncharacterized protein n=1 Tax=Eumeta variegata TaxID=151549 RepID=A0A4C1Z577_EUMVA|nr:hypothetical protein EVAR_90967_1 [Eumeta japonica]
MVLNPIMSMVQQALSQFLLHRARLLIDHVVMSGCQVQRGCDNGLGDEVRGNWIFGYIRVTAGREGARRRTHAPCAPHILYLLYSKACMPQGAPLLKVRVDIDRFFCGMIVRADWHLPTLRAAGADGSRRGRARTCLTPDVLFMFRSRPLAPAAPTLCVSTPGRAILGG